MEIKNAESSDIKEKSKLRGHERLPQEVEKGKYEYKFRLKDLSPERFEKLVSQMKWRISEGGGECIYELGVSDDGIPLGLIDKEFEESIQNLKKMAKAIKAELSLLEERIVEEKPRKRVAELLVRQFIEEKYMDLRIAVLGAENSGKSTTVGTLCSGELDDSRGKSRMHTFNHQHEMISGRTSSISHQIIGFDTKGTIVNYSNFGVIKWKDIVERSSKICHFLDLCGHKKYISQTIRGVLSNIDYCVLMIDGRKGGLTKMTKEHFQLALALKVPTFICITKIDIAPKHILEKTTKQLKRILTSVGVRKFPMFIKKKEDVLTCAKMMISKKICPIFHISNVTGDNLELLKAFLNVLPVTKEWKKLRNKKFEFMIDQTFSVTGIGTIVGGSVLSGTVSTNNKYMLGPDSNGKFKQVSIKSIHHKRIPVKYAYAGDVVTFALRKVDRNTIRKGMVLVEEKNPKTYWTFEANVTILHHTTGIKKAYEAVIHTLSIKQTAKILKLSCNKIRTGEQATVVFQFCFRPEYIKEGYRFIFREGKVKGIGIITKLLPTFKGEDKKTEKNDVLVMTKPLSV